MAIVVKMIPSALNKDWLGFVAGKLIPLVHSSAVGKPAEHIYQIAKERYRELKLDEATVKSALEMLCEIGHARRSYRPGPDSEPDGIARYKLTPQGTCLLALQLMSNHSDISVEIL